MARLRLNLLASTLWVVFCGSMAFGQDSPPAASDSKAMQVSQVLSQPARDDGIHLIHRTNICEVAAETSDSLYTKGLGFNDASPLVTIDSFRCPTLNKTKVSIPRHWTSSWHKDFSSVSFPGLISTDVGASPFDDSWRTEPSWPDNDEPQSQTGPQPSGDDAAELAKKLNNPVASMISVPFQSNFDFGLGPKQDGFRYTMNIQPVIPIALSSTWNLISRTIFPIIHQNDVVGTTEQTGIGDIVQSFFFSPNKTKPFIWGAGPAFLIPTASSDFLGSGKFGLGPTLVVLKQQGPWTYGFLWNHIWSVAGPSDREHVSSTFIQPFISYTTKTAWTFSINSESSYDWNSGHWSVPIHPGISKLVRFGKQPVSFAAALRCWATSPSGGPQGCGFRLAVTLLFPKG